jgi:hypothetical protein
MPKGSILDFKKFKQLRVLRLQRIYLESAAKSIKFQGLPKLEIIEIDHEKSSLKHLLNLVS